MNISEDLFHSYIFWEDKSLSASEQGFVIKEDKKSPPSAEKMKDTLEMLFSDQNTRELLAKELDKHSAQEINYFAENLIYFIKTAPYENTSKLNRLKKKISIDTQASKDKRKVSQKVMQVIAPIVKKKQEAEELQNKAKALALDAERKAKETNPSLIGRGLEATGYLMNAFGSLLKKASKVLNEIADVPEEKPLTEEEQYQKELIARAKNLAEVDRFFDSWGGKGTRTAQDGKRLYREFLTMRNRYKERYYTVTHGQTSEWGVVSDFFKQLVKAQYPDKNLKDFKVLRMPLEKSDKAPKTVREFFFKYNLLTFLPLFDWIVRSEILSVSTGYADTTLAESALSFWSKNTSIAKNTIPIIQYTLARYHLSEPTKEEAIVLITDIQNEILELDSVGNFYMINLPQELVDNKRTTIMYHSLPYGSPLPHFFSDRHELLKKDSLAREEGQARILTSEITSEGGIKIFRFSPASKEMKNVHREKLQSLAVRIIAEDQLSENERLFFLHNQERINQLTERIKVLKLMLKTVLESRLVSESKVEEVLAQFNFKKPEWKGDLFLYQEELEKLREQDIKDLQAQFSSQKPTPENTAESVQTLRFILRTFLEEQGISEKDSEKILSYFSVERSQGDKKELDNQEISNIKVFLLNQQKLLELEQRIETLKDMLKLAFSQTDKELEIKKILADFPDEKFNWIGPNILEKQQQQIQKKGQEIDHIHHLMKKLISQP